MLQCLFHIRRFLFFWKWNGWLVSHWINRFKHCIQTGCLPGSSYRILKRLTLWCLELGCASVFVMHLWIVFLHLRTMLELFLRDLQQIKLFVFLKSFWSLISGGLGLKGTMGCMYIIIYTPTVHVHVYHIIIFVHTCMYTYHDIRHSHHGFPNWIILAIRVDVLILPGPQQVAAVGDLSKNRIHHMGGRLTRGHANNSTVHLMLDRL